MNIKDMPVGTRLVWDAPEPFHGYVKQVYGKDSDRIIHPAVIVEQQPERNRAKVRTSTKSNWMGYEQEWLRMPTDDEIATLNWPSPIQ